MPSVNRCYLIRKHGLWYRPGEAGYTSSAILAGRYTLDEAIAITHPNGLGYPRDGMTYVHEHDLKDEEWLAHKKVLDRTNSYPSVAKFLDRHVLQHMEECRDSTFGREEYAFPLRCFVNEWVTKDMARAICRSLTDRGFCFYMRGLWSEDGMPGGAGYGITDKGAKYLETLFEEMEE